MCVPEEKAKTEINLGTICNDTKLQIEDEDFQSQRIPFQRQSEKKIFSDRIEEITVP